MLAAMGSPRRAAMAAIPTRRHVAPRGSAASWGAHHRVAPRRRPAPCHRQDWACRSWSTSLPHRNTFEIRTSWGPPAQETGRSQSSVHGFLLTTIGIGCFRTTTPSTLRSYSAERVPRRTRRRVGLRSRSSQDLLRAQWHANELLMTGNPARASTGHVDRAAGEVSPSRCRSAEWR